MTRRCFAFGWRATRGMSILAAALALPMVGGHAAGAAPVDRRVSLAVNPVKLLYGLANLEIEMYVSHRASVAAWGERLVSQHLIKRERHPTAVVRCGPRWYWRRARIERGATGYLMPFAGYSWSSQPFRRHCDIGAETGLRWALAAPYDARAKAVLTRPLSSSPATPGVEALISRTF